VGTNLSPEVVDYFKGLSEETGLPYQKLIDLYLLDCDLSRPVIRFWKILATWTVSPNELRKPSREDGHAKGLDQMGN